MTLQGKNADKFWFTLCHELAHICLGHLDKSTNLIQEDEDAANLLVSHEAYKDFVARGFFLRLLLMNLQNQLIFSQEF